MDRRLGLCNDDADRYRQILPANVQIDNTKCIALPSKRGGLNPLWVGDHRDPPEHFSFHELTRDLDGTV